MATESIGGVDWIEIERRVRSISRYGDEGVRLAASPEDILALASYLAELYRAAGRPLPDALAVLV